MYYQNNNIEIQKSGEEEITNNVAFDFIPLIPMLQLFRIKDVWKYLSLVVIMLFLVMSVKRGAILAGGVLLLLFVKHQMKSLSIKHIVYILALSMGLLYLIYIFSVDQYWNSEYFQTRVDQTLSGNSSGRDWLYEHFWAYFTEKTTPLEFLIGNGSNATKALLGQYAHNDWLEFAINQGALGVIIYAVYWIVFCREWLCYKGPEVCKHVLGDIIIAYFLISLYSMSIDGMPFTASLCIGYCLAMNVKSIYCRQIAYLEEYDEISL
jgi:hypothetical protein